MQAAVGADYLQVGAPIKPSRPAAPQRVAAPTVSVESQREQAKAAARRQKEEDAKVARRRAAVERAKAKRDSQAPLAAALIAESKHRLIQETHKSLDNVTGADCSYVRALYALNTLQTIVKDSVLFDEPSAAAEFAKELLPLAAIEDDDDAVRSLDHFSSTFLAFGDDGDAHTMFNLLTSLYGSKGSRDEVVKAGNCSGLQLGVQLLIQHNLRTALAATGMVADAFTAVESNGVFHTPSSAANFLTIARTLVSHAHRSIQQTSETATAADVPFTLLEVRNGCICLVRALSNDGCGRCADGAAELLTAMSEMLIESAPEALVALPFKKTSKSLYFPLLPSDITFIVDFAARGRITSSVASVLLAELGMDHHPDVSKTCFLTLLSLLEGLASSGSGTTDLHGALVSIAADIVAERGGDVFPVWGDSFSKTPAASSLVLDKAVKGGAALDRLFVEKIQKRLSKTASPTQQQRGGSSSSVDAALSAVNTAVKKGAVEDVVGAAKKNASSSSTEVATSRRSHASRDNETRKVEGCSGCGKSFAFTLAKVALVAAVVGGLFSIGKI